MFKPPRIKVLTEHETISDYTSWQSNVLFNLSLRNEFSSFIGDTVTWSTKSVANRGLRDDENGEADNRKTAVQKNTQLEYMLGYVAQHAPALLRNDIVRNATSLNWIWRRIRKHYGFNQSEVHFLKLHAVKREPEERYETLYQRIRAHLEDNLLTVESGILHDGAALTTDEVLTPTVERVAVYLWLHLIDIRLPSYVSRVYAHDLQSKSLKDVQPQICEAMDSLLAEMASQDEVQINVARSSYPSRRQVDQQPGRMVTYRPNTNRNNTNRNNTNRDNDNNNNNNNNNSGARPRSRQQRQRQLNCVLCKAAGRYSVGHDISSCWFISKVEKLEVMDAFQINITCDNEESYDFGSDSESNVLALSRTNTGGTVVEQPEHAVVPVSPTPEITPVRRVQCDMSPFFYAFFKHFVVKIVIDSGAQSSMISASFVRKVNLKQEPTLHGARQLDKSSVKVSGEIHFELSFGTTTLPIDGLVNEHLDCDILAGVPFCKENNIVLIMPREEISIKGHVIPYGCKPDSLQHDVYHTTTTVLRNDQNRIVYPGDYVEVSCGNLDTFEDEEVAIEPRRDSAFQGEWPSPSISRVIQGSVRIPNNTDEPIRITKCKHFAQIRRVTTPDILNSISSPNVCPVQPQRKLPSTPMVPHSSAITLNPDHIMDESTVQKFRDLNMKYDNVFNPAFSRYNGASGPFVGDIKFGNVEPPASKTKIPFYNQSDLRQLQIEADKLEERGVLVRPEDVGLDVKFASPSFLRTKPCGGLRFVTNFTELGQYTRTLPVSTVTTDSVLRRLAQWKYVIKTDLTQSFFQIPVSRRSMPYLGTVTPFKGLRLYSTLVMGMPGSSELLQELLSRVLGEEMSAGWVLVIADDMHICANSISDLLDNWEIVLRHLHRNNLSLKGSKTLICPRSFDVLGWRWESGKLSVTPHKIIPLASADQPLTVTNMRSFIGAFKALSRCIPGYSSLMSPLEEAIKGMNGSQKVQWTDALSEHFARCKEAIKSPLVLTIPTPGDQLILTVDASPVNSGIGATLFVSRDGKRSVADCFSMKLKSHHLGWEPCEHEALAIAAAVHHYSPYIRESLHPIQILSDSKPCVQAYAKLRKGHFSASARISTFLSTLSQYSVIMCHLKGGNNTSSDYASRNPRVCQNATCQVCAFVNDLSSSVVRHMTVDDVLSGSVCMPFLNKAAWKTAQHDSGPLRRVHAHLTQGTRPARKARNVRDVKRYVSVGTINDRGLIVVKKSDPFVGERELVVVPKEILPGLLTAMHIHFNHASKAQLAKLFDRHFYAISHVDTIQDIVDSCTHCKSLLSLKKELFEQTSTASPTAPGQQFSADVIERCSQKIFVVREVLTSFTVSSIIRDQKADTLRSAILNDTSLLRLPSSTIRIDSGPGFLSLKGDRILAEHGLRLDFGRVKNVNKNPVAERANQELERELLQIDPSGSPVSSTTLQKAVKSLNTRIRQRGLSSQEMVFCRDQTSGERLNVDDLTLSCQQEEARLRNHPHSSLSKARGAPAAPAAAVSRGDLVFIKTEGSKHKPREMYLVMDTSNGNALLQKLDGSKFQPTRYEVPLANVYPAIKPPPAPREACESSSDSDEEIFPIRTHPVQRDDASSSSDGGSEEGEDEEKDPPYVPPNNRYRSRDIVVQRRTPRSHHLPKRYGEWVQH